MLNEISIIVGLATTVVCGLIAYPLKTAIEGLSKNIDRLTEKIDDNNEQIINLRERTAKVEASAKQAHRRVDNHDERIGALEHRCETCGRND